MTKAEWSGWMQAIGAALALGIAIWLPWNSARKSYAATRRGHLKTIATDVRIADRQADVYLKSKIKVPGYRVPLFGVQTALPWLLAEGELTTSQTTALIQWYVDAKSFNDSLDLAQQLKTNGGDWEGEIGRTRNKANHLVKGGKLSRFDDAIKVLGQLGLPARSLERIPLRVNLDDEEAM